MDFFDPTDGRYEYRPKEDRENTATSPSGVILRKKLIISYDGTGYVGWQIQPNGLSVQQVIEERLSMIYANQMIRLEASGRTDTGVHAVAQSAHFDEPERLSSLSNEKIFDALNKLLPQDIRITDLSDVEDSFHARFSAKAKTYAYVINVGKQHAFTTRWNWHMPLFKKLCEVRKGMEGLIGTHDFSSFTVERTKIDNAERKMLRVGIVEFENYKCLHFTSEGFLYKMVRSLVGTLASVGSGKISSEEFIRILKQKDRAMAFATAPPQGLFLMKVFYDEAEINDFEIKTLPFFMNS